MSSALDTFEKNMIYNLDSGLYGKIGKYESTLKAHYFFRMKKFSDIYESRSYANDDDFSDTLDSLRYATHNAFGVPLLKLSENRQKSGIESMLGEEEYKRIFNARY